MTTCARHHSVQTKTRPLAARWHHASHHRCGSTGGSVQSTESGQKKRFQSEVMGGLTRDSALSSIRRRWRTARIRDVTLTILQRCANHPSFLTKTVVECLFGRRRTLTLSDSARLTDNDALSNLS